MPRIFNGERARPERVAKASWWQTHDVGQKVFAGLVLGMAAAAVGFLWYKAGELVYDTVYNNTHTAWFAGLMAVGLPPALAGSLVFMVGSSFSGDGVGDPKE